MELKNKSLSFNELLLILSRLLKVTIDRKEKLTMASSPFFIFVIIIIILTLAPSPWPP